MAYPMSNNLSDSNEGFNFQIKDRLHIMPIGYEYERAYKAAKSLKADRVILIGHEGNEGEDSQFVPKIMEKLDEFGIDNDDDYCDIFDLFEALGVINEKISENTDNDVYVNVATGGKITAIAGMIACMVSGATPYYVQAKDYSEKAPKGIEDITELPRYHIDSPDRQHIEILNFINEQTGTGEPPTKGDLIEFSERNDLQFIAGMDVKDKSKYRILDNYIIDPLENKGYITVGKSGRERRVEITEDGQNTLRAFHYMINV